MESLLRQVMKMSMSRKRARKLREMRKMVEGPMQSNWLSEGEVPAGVGGAG
jgi:hypothetical protein